MSFRPLLNFRPWRGALALVALAFAAAIATPTLVADAQAQGRSPEMRRGRPIEGEILVKYKPGVASVERAEARAALGNGTRKLRDFHFIRTEYIKTPRGLSTEQAIARLMRNPNVEYAEPNYEITLDATPNDPRFNELYAMRNTGQTGGTAGADVRATSAWDIFTGDPNLLVGIIDTGMDYNHPDLAANAWINSVEAAGTPGVDDDNNGYVDDIRGYDFVNNDGDAMDDNGHGSHCAGTIGGVGNNGVGISGVNWNVKMVGIKFLSAGGSGSTEGAIASVEYAIAIGCRLTSNSWGGGGFSQALLDAINAAGAAGQLFIAAAGNSSSNNDTSPHYPSSYDTPYIIGVAATDHNDGLASFSSFGATSVDIGAPGDEILSCQPGGGYQLLSGTSMATPHVAGAAAMVWGRFPNASNLQVKQLLLLKADPIPSLLGKCVSGARLNVFLAIADPDSTAPGQVTDLATQNPGSTTMELAWTATGDDGGTGTASRYDVRWSTNPIPDETAFDAANAVEGPDPQPAGAAETFEVPGLTFSTQYYFALKALDEFGNEGPVSNVATGTTLGEPQIALAPTSLGETLLTGAQADQVIAIANTGQGRLDWTAPTPELLFSQLGNRLPVEEVPVQPAMFLAKGQEDPRPGMLGRGGPDAFGYRWVDSDEPGGPTFGWVDITGVGTQLALQGDDAISAAVNLGFAFPFYGNSFSSLRVCTNGFATFTDNVTSYSNGPLPTTGGAQNMLAPFWDDFDFGATPRVWTHYDGTRFIVSWIAAPHYSSGGPYSFQILVYPSGEIRYQYLTMNAPTNSATVGIQNATETVGLTVASNASYVHDALVVQFVPLRQWLSVSPTSGRIPAGQSQNLTVHFDATGLNGGVYDGNVVVLSNDPDDSPALAAAQLTVIGAPNITATPDTSAYGTQYEDGSYGRNVTVSNNGTDQLDVTGITLAGTGAGGLTAGPGVFSLASGASQVVALTWSPANPGTLDATVTIASNDPDTPSLVLHATGEAVIAPSFSVDPRNFEETLNTNSAVSRTMRIENHGGSALDYDLSTVALSGTPGTPGTESRTPRHVDGDAENVLVAKGATDVAGGPMPLDAGGPDAFGYRWTDSAEPGGPVFAWVDISGTGTAIPFTGDDQTLGPFPIGFSFPFYGTTFSNFRVCTNGWLSFTAAGTAYANTTLPNNGSGVPENLVAPFWDDLDFRTLGDAYYQYDGTKLIVQYQGVPRYNETAANTFQLHLYPDGRLLYQYLSITTATNASHTIGIQNALRDDGLQVVYNNASWIANGKAVRFTPPARWLTATPLAGTVPAGGFADVTVGFNAAGLYGGDYEGVVRISSNDPVVSEYDVECLLHVVGVPDIVATPDPIDFGPVFLGFPQIRQVSIQNAGTDALIVDEVTSDNAAYTPNANQLVIPPLGSAIVNVSFNPAAEQAYPATLTIKSNDPDTQFRVIALTGSGLAAPDQALSAAAMGTYLAPNTSTTQTLSLSNDGGSDLDWSFGASVDAAAESFVSYAALALGKGEVDPRAGIDAAGGPDAFGYKWMDSDEPGGPAFAWLDITGVGSQLAGFAADDRTKIGVPIGFAFPFYGASHTTLNICTNGWLSFTETDSAFTNQALPSAGLRVPKSLVAPFWDDMDLRTTGAVWTHNDGSRFIVSWVGVPHWTSGAPAGGPYTYQAILYPSGKIVYQYLAMTPPKNSATVGIQNETRDIGLMATFNTDYAHDGLAVQFTRTPEWLSITPQAGTVPAGGSVDLTVGYDATGLELGTYLGNLHASSNDPDEGAVDVPVELVVSTLVATDPVAPRSYGLRMAGANPTRSGRAAIELALPTRGDVDVTVYDVRGAHVRSLAHGTLGAGLHSVRWDGLNAAGRAVGAGKYYVSARTAGGTFRTDVVLLP